jgi:hypothetical protein
MRFSSTWVKIGTSWQSISSKCQQFFFWLHYLFCLLNGPSARSSVVRLWMSFNVWHGMCMRCQSAVRLLALKDYLPSARHARLLLGATGRPILRLCAAVATFSRRVTNPIAYRGGRCSTSLIGTNVLYCKRHSAIRVLVMEGGSWKRWLLVFWPNLRIIDTIEE